MTRTFCIKKILYFDLCIVSNTFNRSWKEYQDDSEFNNFILWFIKLFSPFIKLRRILSLRRKANQRQYFYSSLIYIYIYIHIYTIYILYMYICIFLLLVINTVNESECSNAERWLSPLSLTIPLSCYLRYGATFEDCNIEVTPFLQGYLSCHYPVVRSTCLFR